MTKAIEESTVTQTTGPARHLSLSGTDWRLYEGHTDAHFANADGEWISATVPGNIQADLEAAHHLKPLWYGSGDPRLPQMALKTWWYQKSFFVPATFDSRRLTLVFDGVDFSCSVWVNGCALGAHAGMFRQFSFDVSELIRPGEQNEIAVRIDPMPAELLDLLSRSDGAMSGGGPDYPHDPGPDFFIHGINQMRRLLKDLKSPTNFGWDWGVNIYTLGIWRDVRLEATGAARIEAARVESRLTDDYKQATVQVEVEIGAINAAATLQATAEFIVTNRDGENVIRRDITLERGKNRVDAHLTLDDPHLWWPNGHGEQPLYALEVRLHEGESGQLSDQRMIRFGVREVRWEQVAGAPSDFINPYRLIVNGRPIRMIGSNIIPPDLLFGRMNRRGLRLIELAHHAGLNTLRVWGGGALLTDEMYDLADELGIMLSQEFPLANCYPETDPTFLSNLEQTVGDIIRRLRNHPCIIEWSGGNEMNWRQGENHSALHVLEQVTDALDNRIFRATCPIQGSRHSPWNYDPETHYRHYDDEALTDNIGTSPLMRYGEFGCASPAHLEVWQREIPPGDRWPPDDEANVVLTRKNVVQAVFASDFWLQKRQIETLFGPIDDLETLVMAGQFLGAHGLRYAIDALRRRGERLGGLTTWDYNEPWPNGAGSYLVDYDGRPLMSYAFMRQAVAPIALSLQYESNTYQRGGGIRAGLWLTSDAPEAVDGLQWEWLAYDRRGGSLGLNAGESAIRPQQALQLDEITVQPDGDAAGIVLIELRLRDNNGRILTERVHLFGAAGDDGPLRGALPDATGAEAVRRTMIRARATMRDNEFSIHVTNEGSMTAFFVEPQPLIAYRTDLLVSDHYIFVPPGETRVVTIRPSAYASTTLSLPQTGWRLTSWNAPDVIIPPQETVLFAAGRHDSMCQEFMIPIPAREETAAPLTIYGNYPNAADIPYLLGNDSPEIQLLFDVAEKMAGRAANLLIHTADRDDSQPVVVTVFVNSRRLQTSLPPGLGIQKSDPAHLAFPETVAVELPPGTLNAGQNRIQITVPGGWLTLDALCLVSVEDA